MKILYYGVGGGTGHLVRGISILRKFKQFERILITSSTFSNWGEKEGIKILKIPSKNVDFNVVSSKIRNFIKKNKSSLLFVDTFPTGCFGELGDIDLRKAFIKRTECNYEGYDYVFDLNKMSPVLIRNWNELKDRNELRARYGISPQEKVIFFYHNTSREEVEKWVFKVYEVSKELGLKFYFSSGFQIDDRKINELNLSHFPAIEILPMADIVVTGAGYNSYMEVSTLFNSAIFIPFFRKIDNQAERIDVNKFFKIEDSTCLKEIIEKYFEKFYFKGNIHFKNGADYIFEKIKIFLN